MYGHRAFKAHTEQGGFGLRRKRRVCSYDPPSPSAGGSCRLFLPLVGEGFVSNPPFNLRVYKNGAGGIRTPGTLLGHNSLAGSPIRPLSHRSINSGVARTEQGGFGLRRKHRVCSYDPSTPSAGGILPPFPPAGRRG